MGTHIVVYGAGAMGGQVAVRLCNAGTALTVVEPWAPQREAIARGGLTVHHPDSQEHARPRVLAPGEIGAAQTPVDVLLLCVKSYDTEAALETARPHLSGDALVVSMQNSINEERIAPLVAPAPVVGGVILVNGSLERPGHVTANASVSRATAGGDLPEVYVGEYLAPAGARAALVAEILGAVWRAETIDDLLHERWSKLATNCMLNPVAGISGLRSADLLAHPGARRIGIRIAAEVARVASAEGHPLARILGEHPVDEVYRGAAGRSDTVDRALAERARRVGPGAITSMLQDVRSGRRTEVDHLTGLVSEKGRRHGIPTPYCDAVTALVHRVEAGTLAPTPGALLEVDRLVDA